ncbi:hypothetical protein NMP99_13190 [Glutamicibacter mishrai]|nr:hypothetical protein [Glutamicibacter mishrai]UTT38957.1 hypothetical protein NMP99_13190 [Glutamicibacter mishrai]
MADEQAIKSLEGIRVSWVLINGGEMTFDPQVPTDLEPIVKTLLEGH